MKYKNALSILPEELIETIQQYVQGEYIYIPIRDRAESTRMTEYDIELQKRDEKERRAYIYKIIRRNK